MLSKGALFMTLAGVAQAGCGSADSAIRTELYPRAAFELGCESSQLRHVCLDEGQCRTVGVSGCGKKVVYMWEPKTRVWILNSDSRPDK